MTQLQATLCADGIVDYLAGIFVRRGAESYLGEPVTMSEHMLQSAMAAERAHASDELIVAALLHDIGHYSNEIPEHLLMQGTNNHHDEAGATFLAAFFPPAITEPIRNHVAAKRYLCSVDSSYERKLSEASQYTLKIQGGLLSPAKIQAFESNGYLQQSIDLRGWDDQGKDPNIVCSDFEHYRSLIETFVIR